MLVLGIDPGSHNTGWGLVRSAPGKLHHVKSGVIAVRGDVLGRLRQIADGLDALLAEYGPDEVSIESIYHHKNSQSALKLGQARGVALLSVARCGAELFEYSPAEIKRAATGNGRAPKELVARMVRMILGYRGELPLDASDALAAAICHAQRAPALGGARAALTDRFGT